MPLNWNEIRDTVNRWTGGRPPDNQLTTITEDQLLKFSLKDLKQVARNGCFKLNPQIPKQVEILAQDIGKKEILPPISAQNHKGVNSIIMRNFPHYMCGDGNYDMYLYEEAYISFIKMRVDILNYLKQKYSSSGILIPEKGRESVLNIRESFRTFPHQQKMVDQRPKDAAPVGRSNHQGGLALDLGGLISKIDGKKLVVLPTPKNQEPSGPVYEWMNEYAWEYGWRRTVDSEAWHWEYRKVWVGKMWKKNGNKDIPSDMQFTDNLTGNIDLVGQALRDSKKKK